MKNVRLYCCTINYFKVLDVLPDYILPVGLGNNNFPENWLTEKKGENISSLNPYYAEFTMFYWIWKNKLRDLGENDFIGTCQHRWLWLNEFYKKKQRFSFGSLYSKLLNPQNEIFEIYEKLRPGRAKSKGELISIARKLKEKYHALILASFVEEAADIYEKRDLFNKRY